MFSLKPTLQIPPRQCPNCHSTLTTKGFLINGMRNLADLNCPQCNGEFYGDLPSGQGLFTPILLNKNSGEVFGGENAKWFADWLADAYKNKSNEKIGFEIKKFSAAKSKIVVLNCLDVLYGHSLLKLLNAQYYLDQTPDVGLIVIIPPFLEWLLPDGICEAWIIDLPLRRGTEWNDFLADEINKRLENFSEVFLSVAFSHPHSEDFDIERFSRIAPFPLENFGNNKERPVVTFIWREDRLWETPQISPRFGNIKRKFGIHEKSNDQTAKVVRFAESLRGEFPQIDFAVAGLGKSGGLPEWISDLRLTKLNVKAEKLWCERYAKSQIVVGVHGSNMLLPTAHAGAFIELIGEDRTGNFLQDILFRQTDAREMFFRYRFLPLSTAPEIVAQTAISMLRFEDFRRLMSPEFAKHREEYEFGQWQT